jgi:restriction endonuclease S subunit
MSNDLCKYKSLDLGNGSIDMSVTAFVGADYGYSVQFTIGDKYCALAENQVRDLILTLQKRVRSVKAYKATSTDLNIRLEPAKIR